MKQHGVSTGVAIKFEVQTIGRCYLKAKPLKFTNAARRGEVTNLSRGLCSGQADQSSKRAVILSARPC